MGHALTVDDLVSGKVAEELGEGKIPTAALLIVETMSEDGRGLRYVLSHGTMTWTALGMLRSTQLSLEEVDMASWRDEEE